MKKNMKSYSRSDKGSNETPFPGTARPNNDWAYAGGMVPEHPAFGSAPMQENMGRFPHHPFGIAGLGAALEDGPSGMDRHVKYIVPTGTNNKFENGGTT